MAVVSLAPAGAVLGPVVVLKLFAGGAGHLQPWQPTDPVALKATVEGGTGYQLTGHHELMVPLLAWSVLSMIDGRG